MYGKTLKMNFRLLLSSTTCLFRTFDDLQIENIHLFGSAGGQAVYQLGPDFQMSYGFFWNDEIYTKGNFLVVA